MFYLKLKRRRILRWVYSIPTPGPVQGSLRWSEKFGITTSWLISLILYPQLLPYVLRLAPTKLKEPSSPGKLSVHERREDGTEINHFLVPGAALIYVTQVVYNTSLYLAVKENSFKSRCQQIRFYHDLLPKYPSS